MLHIVFLVSYLKRISSLYTGNRKYFNFFFINFLRAVFNIYCAKNNRKRKKEKKKQIFLSYK